MMGNFGDGCNTIANILLKSPGSSILTIFIAWKLGWNGAKKIRSFAGIISKVQAGPHDRLGTAISRSELTQYPRNQLGLPPWRPAVPGAAQSKCAFFCRNNQ
jgi:hypothetical protein